MKRPSIYLQGFAAFTLLCPSISAAEHLVDDFNWVNALSSVYSGDPENTLTFTADAAGSVFLASSGTVTTPAPVFSGLTLGAETTGIGDVETYNYTFTFDEPVSGLDFFVIGFTNDASSLENFSNFSVTPDTVTNVSNQTWDGTTLSSTSSGSQGSMTFDGPLTSLSFTYTGAGTNTDGTGISGMSWTTVPEPSTGLLCGLFALCALKRRRA